MKTRIRLLVITGLTLCAALWAMPRTAHAQIFVVKPQRDSIAEYNLDGTPINASLVTGLDNALSIAVDGEDLYVANGNEISEYTTSGTLVNASLVTGLTGGLYGIDVEPVPEPSMLPLAGFGGLSLLLLRCRRK